MALRNQPYLPLYVQDFLTDEKLMECSALATGVFIKVLCVMHKSETYGTILLKQKDKQNDKQVNNFALKLSKFLPWNTEVILLGLEELLQENVLSIEGDFIIQKRMVKDGIISDKRSKSGSKGGMKSLGKNSDFARAKTQANSEDEIENEIQDESKNEVEVYKKPTEKKIDYDQIKDIFNQVCHQLPKVQKLSDARKKLIMERAKEHGLETIGEVFRNVSESDFMNGINKTGWTANFDWIFNRQNFLKIFEGNYKNKIPATSQNVVGRQTKETFINNASNWEIK